MTYWYVDGKKWLEETYKDGKKSGKVTGYYPNGLKRMQEHWNGTKDGQYFQWFGNGKEKIVGNYKDGKEAGKWFEYNKEGEIERIANYDE